ncbi:hypothetical protein [Lutimonas sp.]|uniref:hypothetical protein n=1 Tax=Lutimonas sp. TaxID=1872403 RepID=UPI003D9BAB11
MRENVFKEIFDLKVTRNELLIPYFNLEYFSFGSTESLVSEDQVEGVFLYISWNGFIDYQIDKK